MECLCRKEKRRVAPKLIEAIIGFLPNSGSSLCQETLSLPSRNFGFCIPRFWMLFYAKISVGFSFISILGRYKTCPSNPIL
ncbi:MAG: hypothetical protein ACKO86_21365, partial [Dolichospermum sp.]